MYAKINFIHNIVDIMSDTYTLAADVVPSAYTDCQGWTHEYYTSPSGTEYVCHKGGVVITHIKNFIIIKCAPRSIVDKVAWVINLIAASEFNNADIGVSCDVYTGEYIRVDISLDDGEYNVFNKRNMLLYSDVIDGVAVKKLDKLGL